MTHTRPATLHPASPEDLYDAAVAAHGPALVRLARSYEADPDRRQDLLQDIHFALWRSFASYERRCSLRTWVYRVAHNVAASHVLGFRLWSRLVIGVPVAVVFCIGFARACVIAHRKARRYQQEIDELDALRR